MKKHNIISITVLLLAILLCCTALLAPTISKYISLESAPYGDEAAVNYTVNSVFEVKTQEELFAAINQGYTFIQLSKEIENPLIITQSAKDLDADLILDLNGIEIQRNGHEPILNVGKGVRLTVTDTSAEQTGGLYNPVGSVFHIEEGGVLSVVTGVFESGPRYSEYYSYNESVLMHNNYTKRTEVEDNSELVTIVYKDGTEAQCYAPIIKSYPVATGDIIYNHGNLYFDVDITRTPAESTSLSTLTIPADTYCYYKTSEDASDLNTAKDADWTYTYFVDKDTHTYQKAALEEGDDESKYIEVFIYGYQNVITGAASHSTVESYYAAIQMTGGTLDVQKGEFFNYFGIDKTACVNAAGGEIKIAEGVFSSRIPDAVRTTADTIVKYDIKESDTAAFGDTYFEDFLWANESMTAGAQARQGEGYGILNSGNAVVSIGTGDFYASNNNIINMSDGTLSIGGGSFTKNINQLTAPTANTNNDAAIFMTKGTLDVQNANYTVLGNYARAVYMLDGTLTITNSPFAITGDNTRAVQMVSGKLKIDNSEYTVSGSNTYGIYSTVSGTGNFAVSETDFYFTNGDNQIGIYAENGEIYMLSNTAADVYTSGANGKGVYVQGGGSVVSYNYNYELDGNTSHGIYSTGGTVTMSGGSITLSGQTCYGIYSTGGTITATSSTISLSGATSTGIHSAGGTVAVTGGSITLSSNDSCYGIYAASADAAKSFSVTVSDAEINVGYAVTTVKTVDECEASIGVFLASANAANAVTLTNARIYSHEIGVALDGGKLDIAGTGEIKTHYASAVAIAGGNLTLAAGSDYEIVSANTTTSESENSYSLYLPRLDGTTEFYQNTDGIYVSGGSFVSNGTITLTHTGLENAVDYDNYTGFVVTSYAIRVEGGAVTVLAGTITANAGGGIYCSKGTADASSITMGAQGAANNITVSTTGTQKETTAFNGIGTYISDGWQSYRSITGGHAIELNGGDITVWGGTYTASYGNGVAANGSGTINVYSGTFYGSMDTLNGTGKSGPAAHYGLKVIGGATVNIYGGSFDGGNGGAFVTGVDTFNSTTSLSGTMAYVYVYGGTFGSDTATDGFNVYDLATVVFGAHPENTFNTAAEYLAQIEIIADNATIAANKITNGSTYYPSYIYIYYGNYNDGNTGIYNDVAAASIYAYNISTRHTDIKGSYTDSGTGFYTANP